MSEPIRTDPSKPGLPPDLPRALLDRSPLLLPRLPWPLFPRPLLLDLSPLLLPRLLRPLLPRLSRPRLPGPLLIGIAILPFVACGGDVGASADEVVIRVEDGVTIVENPGLHHADSLAWFVDPTDVVRIGEVEGPEEYVIGRLGGVNRLPDGSIVVADAITRELRVFDREGRFVRRVGGRGEGPGEYVAYEGFFRPVQYRADSIAVLNGREISILGPDLTFGRRFRASLQDTRAEPPFTSDRLIGVFSEGSLLMSDYLNVCGESRRNGFCEDSVAFYRTDEAGVTQASFGRFVYSRSESRRGSGNTPNIGWSEPHPQAYWTTDGNRFYYADAKRFEIRIHGPDGGLERVVRVRADPRRYTRDEVFPPRAAAGDDPETERVMRVFRQAQSETELPDTFPAFSDLNVDRGGNIWLREYVPPGLPERGPPRWFVFDPEGRLRWSLRSVPAMRRRVLPYSVQDLHIGADWVLGSVRDEYGVESVVLYPLRKGAPQE